MAKKPTSGGSRSPTAGANALGAALDALTRSVTTLNPRLQALASGVGGGGAAPVFPFVDLTGTAAPPEELETDQDKAAKKKQRQEEDEAKDAAGKAAKLAPWESAAKGVTTVTNSLQSLASVAGTPTAAIANIGSQIGKFAAMAGPYGQAAGQIISAVASVPQVMKSAADSVNSYVQSFAPMASGRYQRAWQDLMASIGELMLPVLNACTDAVRFFADTIAGFTPTILPAVQSLMDALRPFGEAAGAMLRGWLSYAVPVVGALASAFGKLYAPLIPLYQAMYTIIGAFFEVVGIAVEMGSALGELIDAFIPFDQVIKMATDGVKAMAAQIRVLIDQVRTFVGLPVRRFDGSSFGKSAQTPEWSDTTAAWKKLVESTVNQGRSTPEERVPTLLEQIKTVLEGLPQKFAADVAAQLAALMNQGSQAVNQVTGGSVQAFADRGLTGVADHLGGLLRSQSLKRN